MATSRAERSGRARDLAALERGAGRHRPHRARVHPEPLRAGALRGGAARRRRHQGRATRSTTSRRRGRRSSARPTTSCRSGWRTSARACPATSRRRSRSAPSSATTRARSCSCSGPTRASGCTRPGWADIGYSPAEVAVKEVAEETGIECEPVRLLVGDRRPAAGLHPLRHVHAGLPLPGHGRRAARPPARDAPTSAGSARTSCRKRPPAPSGGDRWRSPRSEARRHRPASTHPATRSGAAKPRANEL